MSSIHKLIPLIAVTVLVAGCQYVPMIPGITPYRIDVQQGNYVTQDMVAKLKPGMSKSQVRFALGTPLVVDPFHTDRWDYVYELRKRGRVQEQRRIIVLFDNDKLLRIEGDVAPSVKGADANANANANASTTVTLPAASGAAETPQPAPAGEPPAAATTPLK